jgi:enterochelin esterase-like enzyme
VRAIVVVGALVAAAALASFAHAATPTPTPPPPAPASGGLPASWLVVARGPDGGTIWQGRIPDRFVPSDRRASAIYLPPHYDPLHRYPVVYLLHGMAGNPSSFVDGLRIADVADTLISGGSARPFIAVMPVAGPDSKSNNGEWAGVWENFVVDGVVPWVDAHLPTIRSPQGRALEGLSAGGFGAVDIGLRHLGIFGTLGSWDGYFAPVFRDGPFAAARPTVLAAHNPTLLVRRDADRLRRANVHFYVSVGGNHGDILRAWSIDFAHELTALHMPHELWQLPASERGHFWRATLPSALTYAAESLAG